MKGDIGRELDDFTAKMRWEARRDVRRGALLLVATGALVVPTAFVSSMFALAAVVVGCFALHYLGSGAAGFYALKNAGGMLETTRALADKFESIGEGSDDPDDGA